MSVLHCISLFICFSFGYMQDATGTDFADGFRRFEKSLWIRGDGTIHCHDGYSECALTRINNLMNIVLAKKGQKVHPHAQAEVDIWLRNDCENRAGCCKDGRCVHFTTGEIYSRKSYGYGAYAFRGKMARMIKGNSKAWSTWSCFALRRIVKNFHSEVSLAISMCAATGSKLNSTLHMSVRYGESYVEKKHDAGYDLGSRISLFRFDWFPDVIRFSLNKKTIERITEKDINIPNEPMFLRMMLLPRRVKSEKKIKPLEGKMGANMGIQFVAYKKFNKYDKIDHTELFYDGDNMTRSHRMIWWIVFLLLFLIYFICTHYLDSVTWKEQPKGYQVLLNDP